MTNTLGQGASVKAPPRPPSTGAAVVPPPRRRRFIAVVAGIVVVLAAAGAFLWWPHASTSTSTAAYPATTDPVPANTMPTYTVPSAYTVTYAVTTAGSAPTAERVWVRRPFDSVDITYAGSSPDAAPSLVMVYRLGVQVLKAMN